MFKSKKLKIFVAVMFFFGLGWQNTAQAQEGARGAGGEKKVITVKTKTPTKTKITKTVKTPVKIPIKKPTIKKVTDYEIQNLVGDWAGIFQDVSTSLRIERVEGSTFYGTLLQGETQVSFTGFIDKDTRKITMTETRVIRNKPNTTWTLGINSGTLAGGGASMSGSGKDGTNPPYSWSFSKR